MDPIPDLQTQKKENRFAAIAMLFMAIILVYIYIYINNNLYILYLFFNFETIHELIKNSISKHVNVNDASQLYSYFHMKAFTATNKSFITFLGFYIIWCLAAIFYHREILNTLSKSRDISRKDEPELYDILEKLCARTGDTVPPIQLIKTSALAAFASGLSPDYSRISVTEGLLDTLTKKELRAVLAYELARIRNGDIGVKYISCILIGSLPQFLINMIKTIAQMPKRNTSEDNRLFFLIMLLMIYIFYFSWNHILFMFFAAIIPLILISYAYSYFMHDNEYWSDTGAIDMTGDSEALKNALKKIHSRKTDAINVSAIILEMCIVYPKQSVFLLLSSHARLKDRIDRIDHYCTTY